jgi:hypothetical protein
MNLIPMDLLLEVAKLRRRSVRREVLGFGGTVRDRIGFEKKGERKKFPKRKRPKKRHGDLLSRSEFRSSQIRSR